VLYYTYIFLLIFPFSFFFCVVLGPAAILGNGSSDEQVKVDSSSCILPSKLRQRSKSLVDSRVCPKYIDESLLAINRTPAIKPNNYALEQQQLKKKAYVNKAAKPKVALINSSALFKNSDKLQLKKQAVFLLNRNSLRLTIAGFLKYAIFQ
jgi:hypothetical protein